ncbi:response regulator transcription factor [Pseudobacteroides cellulosolvens]|uniref:ATP-dependent transcriptional regulator, MalT-like, LuxR family n=1 Tax=Pseudobacteroides cellulosolvens ATCC 35603 = DSM 2933 TaxID=398512 RepID=A0A0L6JIV4_9FIRM|nr:response regulator transcription factor [Pseudobacteroides cellulosolvens]KNY25776.1 ATP-dependent transcriptional regulator, MalT-like, LuxR family [Pseudobacteroides cellulosolvens ATCC 35603 = DSM 2933]
MSQKYSIKIDDCFHKLCKSTINKNFNINELQLAHIISDFHSRVSGNKSIYSCKILILPDSLEVEFIEQNPINKFKYDAHSNDLLSCLTSREIDVLTLIDKGKSNREIAEILCLTISTVKTHILNIFGKLGVNRRIQAISKAKELKIIS